MSVVDHYPFYGSKNRVRMGLKSIPASEWIQYEEDFCEIISVKKQLITEQKNRVIQSVKGSEDAQNELLNEILAFIKTYQSDLFSINENSIISHKDKQHYELSKFQSNPLELISYLAADDFCLLEKLDDDYRLVAASVCTPTYWELLEKIGRPMKEVHAPIPKLEENIGRMIRHFFLNLKPDTYFQRSNWFLTTRGDYPLFKDTYETNEDFDGFDINTIKDKLVIRCERQSFRKLSKTGNIVFGIKIYLAPLSLIEAHKDIAQDLISSINAMSTNQKRLFEIDLYENVLMDYLNSVI